MAFAPDYGKKMQSMGVRREAKQAFIGFPLASISALGDDKYSTMALYGLGGIDHAVSLDFDRKILGDILRLLPVGLARQVEYQLRVRPAPMLIRFGSPVRIEITAVLGDPVRVDREEFVPLIIEKVASSAG